MEAAPGIIAVTAMRICLINNLFGPDARGGAERIVEREADGLAALGHAVTVISAVRPTEASGVTCAPSGCGSEAGKPGSATHRTFVAPNFFPYHDLGRHGLAARLFWHIRDMFGTAASRRLGALLDDARPDAVHTHNLMGIGFRTSHLLRHRGLRHVHTVHDVQLLHPSGLITPEAAARPGLEVNVYIAIMRRLMGSPAEVLFPSENLMRLHERHGFFPKSRRSVLRNPAPTAASSERIMPTTASFVFVGQLEPHKGVRKLLNAWRESGLSSATLRLAGDGSLRHEIGQDLPPGVKSLGRLPPSEINALLIEATALIFPSEVIENAPSAILEALAVGTPVIAAKVGGVPELVTDGKNGFLFAPGDGKALEILIGRLAAMSGQDRAALSAAAKVSVQGLGVETHLKRLVAAYRG
jgi:glycosyltransferase involved in cell wall biosynthesis